MARIRPFRETDEPAVARLWTEVFPDDPPWNEPRRVIAAKRAVDPELFLVAEGARGALAGTALGGYDGHRGWLYALAVDPRARRRGIGAALVAAVEKALLARGCVKVNLQVRAANAAVVAFYRRLGYDVEERVSLGKLLAWPPAGEGR